MYNKKESFLALRRAVCCLLLASMLLAALLGFAMPASAAGSNDTPQRTLRVGFYAYTGYHIMDKDGHRSGYSYEVLQRIAQYENVKFEYVAYDCDANEAADMLERGEIDLLPTLLHMAGIDKSEIQQQLLVTHKIIPTLVGRDLSNLATMLTVKAGNRSIVAGDYETYDGMIVGMSRRGNGRNQSFIHYAEEHGFTYTPICFDTDEELSLALRTGVITAAVSNRLRKTNNEWIIDTFDLQDCYIAVRKDDSATLQLVNDALAKMDRDDPTWRTSLFDKYNKNIHSSNKLYLTAAEENYITTHNANGTTFQVLVNPDRYPYSYLDEDGCPTGIMVDLFKLVADRAQLHYSFLAPTSRSEYRTMLDSSGADFVIDFSDDYSTAEDYGYQLTNSYLSAEFSWVMLRSHSGGLSKAVVPDNFNSDSLEMPGLQDISSVKYADSFDDCLAAVRSGDADACYTYTYQAERAVFDDKYNELRAMLSDERRSFCIGVRADYDVLLLSVLNKSVDSLTRADVVALTNKYINLGRQEFSLVRLTYQYPLFVVLIVLCVIITNVCVVLSMRARRFRDLTEAALHRAEEASAAKTAFLSRMSHDIRTPLNGILGLLELNGQHPDDAEANSQNREKAKVAANHLLTLINDILEMSKIEDHAVELENLPFNLTDLCRDIFVLGQIRAKSRDVTLTTSGPDTFAYPDVYGSPLHVRRVFLNLVENCIKYNKPGGSVHCSAEQMDLVGDRVVYRFIISDTGIGMSPEFLKHLFEPFAQANDDARSNYQGTGMGMPIVKALLKNMGGTISVKSELGRGTTFTVDLPFVINRTPEKAVEASADAEECDICGMSILLVEDNELNTEIAQTLLEHDGALVTTAANGKEALELFQAKPAGAFDAILMDVMMPEMNGLEATRCIRAFEGVGPDEGTPIIAMTANVFADDVRACLESGMNSHVGKPLDMRILMREILKYTHRS